MIEFKISRMPSVNLNWWAPTQRQWSPVLLEMQKPFWKDERNPTTGKPWATLNPGYQAWKTKNRPGEPILRLSGKMQDTAKIIPKNEGFAAKIMSYGIYHQYGTKHMPARPWLGIPLGALNALGVIAFKNIFFSKRKK